MSYTSLLARCGVSLAYDSWWPQQKARCLCKALRKVLDVRPADEQMQVQKEAKPLFGTAPGQRSIWHKIQNLMHVSHRQPASPQGLVKLPACWPAGEQLAEAHGTVSLKNLSLLPFHRILWAHTTSGFVSGRVILWQQAS